MLIITITSPSSLHSNFLDLFSEGAVHQNSSHYGALRLGLAAGVPALSRAHA